MIRGVEHLREARAALRPRAERSAEPADPRERLRAAAHGFWSAVFHAESWPAGLRARAEALTGRIFFYGSIDDAVGRMGDRTAAEVSREILGLCEEAERQAGPEGGTDAGPR